MNCASCGTANPSGNDFCMGCGTRLEAHGSACPSCGTAVPQGNGFCQVCGTRVGGPVESPNAYAASPPPPSTLPPAPPAHAPRANYGQPSPYGVPGGPPPAPEGRGGGWVIPVGYLFSLLGGLIGVAIGGSLWRAQERDPLGGAKRPRYDKATRRHGVAILTLGAVMFAFWTQAGDAVQEVLLSSGGGPSSSPPAAAPAEASPAGATASPPSPGSAPAAAPSSRQSGGASAPGLDPDPTPADDLDRAILELLDASYSENLGPEGFRPVIHRALGRLGDETSEEHTISLPPDREVVVIAVCDNDCGDLDLVLFDDGGSLVDSDTEPDKFPLVGFTSGSSMRRYTIRVGMAECSRAPCYYGIGVFVR